MKHHIGKHRFILVLLILATGCIKEIEYNLLKGNLEGVVFSNGEYSEIPAQVFLEGDNFKETTTTYNNGRYLFTGLSTGTYNLKFTKNGFGTYYLYGFPFISGDSITQSVPSVNLAYLPNGSLSDLKLIMTVDTIQNFYFNDIDKIINCSVVIKGSAHKIIAFLSSDANVSYKNYKQLYYDVSQGSNKIELSDYDTLLYSKNSKIYLVMYPYNMLGSSYKDLETGCLIFSGIQTKGASNVASVIVK